MLIHFSHSSQFHRILLVQFGTIRDVIRTLPIINILRLRYPHAKIAWLAAPEMMDFLNHYDIVERIIVAKPGWYNRLCGIKTLRKKLQSYAPDLCLDLHGDISSGLATRISGGGRRISANGTMLRLFGRPKKTEPGETSLAKGLRLLETLDVAGAGIHYDLPEIPLERRALDGIVRKLGLESTPFAMLGVGVQSNSTPWEIDRYVQVAEHLRHTHHLPTVATWQNTREKRIAERIVAESGGMTALAPALSAIPLAALARRTSIFVGTDNDFLYIAAAVGAPCVGVFRDENARRDAPDCDNLQTIMAASGEPRWKRRGISGGTSPVRIDNYTYDVIQACNACDDILRPERIQKQKPLPEKHLVGV